MTCDHLRRLLVLSATVCAMRATSSVRVGRDFDKKVSIMLKEEPGTPKCFAEGRKDFTCFWEEEEEEEEENAGSVDQYSFTYNYQNENSSRCPLTVHRAHSGKKLIVCHLNQTQMFVQMDIEVHRETRLIHNRSLLVELVFLLDPPANVTVSTTGEQGQLNVSWVPPALKYMDDSLMYEVSYETVESHVTQVKVVQASSGVILRGLQPGTKYKARVRVKLDGISYNGYWSMWSDPVFMQTPHAELNMLIVLPTLVMFFILLLVSFIVLLVSNRSFLIKKIWPTIPTPDGKFQGLFTDYGGDFQEWLKQTNGGLWLTPALFYTEDYPTSLEVLSELSLNPPPPTPPLPPKRSRALALQCREEDMQKGQDGVLTERWRTALHNHWVTDCLMAPQQCSQSSLLESQDAYVTLTGNIHNQDHNTPEESLPLEVLFPMKKTALSEAH
uniref:erythropoietin receptor isoform X2 n=1 Tax=Doryrhamphus excisus TaxID=161450 RepID=UPI0025ADA057|nr:erythropoietin receptor isoform X2 [Doryrhamphus excisus]